MSLLEWRSVRGRRNRTHAAVILAAVTSAALVACCACGAPQPNPKLDIPGGIANFPGFGVTNDNMAVGQPVSLGGIDLCVDSPGEAVIISVGISGLQGDLTLDAFAVRRHVAGENYLGAQYEPLTSVGFDPGGRQVVSELCPADVHKITSWIELGIQLTRRSGDIAGGPRLVITYEAGGVTGTLDLPYHFYLCSEKCPDSLGR